MKVFGITLSITLRADDIKAVFSDIIPAGLKIDVFSELDTPEEVGAIWAWLESTHDAAWPCTVNVVCSDSCELGTYPDLRVAEYTHQLFGCNILCETYPFAGNLDPYDPYWALAYVDGIWYLADTVNTLLMNNEMNEKEKGQKAIKLVRLVVVPDIYS
jgi:hypothetical protein